MLNKIKSGADLWIEWNIHSVMPAPMEIVYAAFAEPSLEKDGYSRVVAHPCGIIGLVTITWSKEISHRLKKIKVHKDIAPMLYHAGRWIPCLTYHNYLGAIRTIDDVEELLANNDFDNKYKFNPHEIDFVAGPLMSGYIDTYNDDDTDMPDDLNYED